MKGMKRRVFLIAAAIFLSIVFMNGFALAANETKSDNKDLSQTSKEGVDKGYACLSNIVKSKSSLSLQEAVFSVLALGGEKNILEVIEKEKNGVCWPKSGCKLKESAQVSLAYDRINKNNDDIIKWISSRNISASDLNWYLEIDISSHVPASCTIKYDGNDKRINVKEDMRLDGSPGSCFSFSSSGYWLSIKDSCLDKEFEVSCDQDFVSALLYEKKPSGSTIYVSSETHSASSLGSTKEKVNSKCLKGDNGCDYEGTLWAALALQQDKKDISLYLPYLVTLAENNQKYFPSSFIYLLTGSEDQYSNIVQSQKQGRSWKIIGSPYGEFYDTSLGMLALKSSSANELENTKNYLLSIQGSDGCWNNDNIRDSAFILYSGWAKQVSGASGGSGTGQEICESVIGQACENANSCLDAGGRVLSNFKCSTFGTSCCSVDIKELSCKDQKGIICSSGQKCEGRSTPSSDQGACCLDACINVEEPNTCESFNGICRQSCEGDEEKNSGQSCSEGRTCCQIKTDDESGSSAGLIITLIILIILVLLAIIFRHKLQIGWFKIKGKIKSTSITKPAVPPVSGQNGPTSFPRPNAGQRQAYRPQTQQRPSNTRRPISQKDKELEETLKKLREMSK